MVILRSVALAALVCCFLPTARAADLDPAVPAESEWVLHINVKQLVEAPALHNAGEQLRSGVHSGLEVLSPLTALGLDPLKDLHAVCLAGSGLLQSEQVLLIAHGRFDAAKLRQAADERARNEPTAWKAQKQDKLTIYEVRDKARPRPLFLVFRNDSTLFVSAGKKLVAEVAAADPKKPAKVSKALQELVARADAKDAVWLASVTPDRVQKLLARSPYTTGIADDVTAFTGRISASSILKISFSVQTKKKDAATEVAQLLDAAKGFAVLAGQGVDGIGPLLSDLIDSCKTSTDGNTAILAGQLNEEQIAKALKKK